MSTVARAAEAALRRGVGLSRLAGETVNSPSLTTRVAARQRAPQVTTANAIATVKDVGRLVRAQRKKRKLSQQTFADMAGVGRRFISELENGKGSLEFDKVLKVALAAGIDLSARER